MMRRVCLGVVCAVGVFCFPAAALAQAVITGLVKDASGGVLPGVSVEVASPVLIPGATYGTFGSATAGSIFKQPTQISTDAW